jgi:anaerobic magnesium-protoporphyrin IX monomethyl ester cyclase
LANAHQTSAPFDKPGVSARRRDLQRIAIVQTTHPGASRPEIGLGAGFLKAYLEEYSSYDFQIDCFESNDFLENIVGRADEYQLVALSSVSYLYEEARKISRAIKSNFGDRVTTIIGGVHITSLPSTLSADFDYGAVGEGEQTFLEFVEALKRGASDGDILAIPGIIGLRNGRLVSAPPRSFIDDISSIPFPDREMFNKYRAVPSAITARGCPFKCDFCTNNVLWTRKVRKPACERIGDELQHIVENVNDVRVIVFRDDIVFIKEDYVRDAVAHIEENYPHLLKIPKVGYAHVNTLRPEFAKLLKRLGMYKILCGFESGSERILQILKGGSSTVEQNQRAIEICNDFELDIAGNFIIGTPDETIEDVVMTYEFLLKNMRAKKVSSASTSILTPFPGERYWQIFTNSGVDLPSFDWSRLNESGFSTYYEDTKGRGTVREWWDLRKSMGKIYLGRVPENEFIAVMQNYEPELVELQAEYLKSDRKY